MEVDCILNFQVGTRCNLYVAGPSLKIIVFLVFTFPALPVTVAAACELLARAGGGAGAGEESRAAAVGG